MSKHTYTGACLCGAVRFRLSGPIEVVNFCHCSRCRRRTGSAFATVVHGKYSQFQFDRGESMIRTFQPKAWNDRNFCGSCGSPLPGWDEEDDEVKIPAGLFDQDFDVRPQLHIMTRSKASWHDISDALPQYQEFPEDW